MRTKHENKNKIKIKLQEKNKIYKLSQIASVLF